MTGPWRLSSLTLILVMLALVGMRGAPSGSTRAVFASAPALTTTCTGDVNGDGVVNLTDAALVALHIGTRAGSPGYDARYDVNGDGRITVIDLAIVLSRLGTVCGTAPTSTPTASAATATSTKSPTATSTVAPTNTATATNTATNTPTPTNTSTNTPTPTSTSTNTATATATPTSTATNTPTPTNTPTNTATATNTPTATLTSTPSPAATPTDTATSTATFTATATFTPTPAPTATATATSGDGLPPDPAAIAPPVDDTVATDIFSTTAFLYSGSDPIQTGVAPGTIDAQRVVIMRGRVLDHSRQPLPGARITVLGHPEFGQTLSRADGMFDIAANGGGQLTLVYEKDGYPSAQRDVEAPWRDFAWLPDVILVPYDSTVTQIDAGAGTMQVARGNPVTDADGTRQATLFFPAGTAASMTLPDGSTQPLSTLHIRATEYTVGADGPKAMPAELPPSSMYTYAVELSADEAVAAGATGVTFSQPVAAYLENFINSPVGSLVPAGFYDRQKGEWIPSENGHVVKVVSVTGGVAALDVTGDGVADYASSLGVTADELQHVGALYTAGQTLWRIPLSHFSSFDWNWPGGPPDDSIAPPEGRGDMHIDPHEQCGSIIGCEDQSLGESVPVTGTAFRLHYQSKRTPGRIDAYTLHVPVSAGGALPASLQSMHVRVDVAGRKYEQTYAPAPNVTYTITWDGLDGYGRPLQGAQPANVVVDYVYQAQFYYIPGSGGSPPPQVFGRVAAAGVSFNRNRAASTVTISRTWNGSVGTWDARAAGLGGWDLNVHHAYDRGSGTLLSGDATERRVGATGLGPVMHRYPNAESGNNIVVGPDGSLYYTYYDSIRQYTPDGTMLRLVLGLGSYPNGLALAADGTLFFSDTGNSRVLRRAPDGTVSAYAGNGIQGYSGDDGPATAASLGYPERLALGPDGSLFIADPYNQVIRRVSPSGIITTYAGTGQYACWPYACGSTGDGGPATAGSFSAMTDIAAAPDGSLYVADTYTVRRISPTGILSRVAGTPNSWGFAGDGGPATAALISNPGAIEVAPDGGILISDNYRIRRIGPDGIITTIAGTGKIDWTIDGAAALASPIYNVPTIAMAPDGGIVISVSDPVGNGCLCGGVWKISPVLDGFSGVVNSLVPSEDGRELYEFNTAGRHLRTLDALTSAVLFQFSYDGNGHLASVTDASGNVTAVERDGGGVATAIIAPGGQRTSLTMNAVGWLTSAADPLGDTYAMSYSTGGLLLGMTDPMGHPHRFTYDAGGLLTRDDAPGGTFTTLARAELTNGFQVTTTTALGRTQQYTIERLSTNALRSTTVDASGGTTVAISTPGVSEQTTMPSGATTSLEFGPDPRWGMLAPVIAKIVVTTPGGITRTITSARSATVSDPANLLTLTQMMESVTEGTNTTVRVYNAATRTFTLTTPQGRTSSATLDAVGRIVSVTPDPALAPIETAYDARGRVSSETQDTLTRTYGYDTLNRLTSETDGAGNTTAYAYDAADRTTGVTTPVGHHYGFAYDADGKVTSITMPSGAVHAMTYTARDEMDAYTPPAGGALDPTYNADREWTGQTLASGRTLGATYDAGGRPAGRSYAEASVAFSYVGATERMASMSRTPAGGSAQTNTATWDAELPLTASSSGAAAGVYTFGYDARMMLASMNLSSGADAANIALTRDKDGLLTAYGPFSVSHFGPAGSVSDIFNAQMDISDIYDVQGRLTQRSHVVAGVTVYRLNLSYDAAGRIGQRTETTAAGAETRVYTYDSDGQLTGVSAGGSPVESYSYDTNGNRRSSGAAATYDAADRLTSLGGVAYTFDSDGYLASRGADTFQYSTRGELLSATDGGQAVTYAYDALGRRVSRTQAGATTQYLYGNPANPLQLTASRDGAGVLSVYYYGSGGGLFAIDRGGVRYYVAADQVGSPRVVTDATGAVVKALTYDSYGKALSDSNPAFVLPIGYAGGLADSTTGLVHFGLRDYDAASGTWTSRDPALFDGGSLNLYSYVNGDPVSFADPTGLWAITGGFSAYELLGGGISFTIGSDGLKVCGEIGVGFGGGLEGGYSAKGVGDTQLTLSALADASVKAGPLKAGVGAELSRAWGEGHCTHGKLKIGIGATNSPFEIGGQMDLLHPSLPDYKAKQSISEGPGKSLKFNESKTDTESMGKNIGVSAKLAAKACGGANW